MNRLIALLAILLVAIPAMALPMGGGLNLQDGCLPFTMPSSDAVLNSSRKVFAHYFSPFALSLDNQPWQQDYYAAQYFPPTGENYKHLANGGYLRGRPEPTVVNNPSTYEVLNIEKEMRAAIAHGINGWVVDILSTSDLTGAVADILTAQAAVDSRFAIVLEPDMSSLSGGLTDFSTIATSMAANSQVYRVNGNIVLAPFYSEAFTPAQWQSTINMLAGDGIDISFFPTFLSLPSNYAQFAGFSIGIGIFGTPAAGQGTVNASNASLVHALGLLYMAGISPQGYRPKSYIYWEANGSLAYRNSWGGAISGASDWVEVATWNDFSETTQVAPYQGWDGAQGNGYYNLTAYYAAWFITRNAPPITHDVIYYFYRREPYAAAAPLQGSALVSQGDSPVDIIELLGFLTAPGTLQITQNSTVYQSAEAAGLQSFTAPLSTGTPNFELVRGGVTVISLNGDVSAVGSGGITTGPNAGYNDLTYWSNSASGDLVCRNLVQ